MRLPAVAALLLLAGCAHRVAPGVVATPRYVVGAAYERAGVWHYPRESFQAEATGLAERLPDRVGLTADGEAFDPTAMAAAHATLQLPAIIGVTNLETGRQVRLRLNDRGPDHAGRVLGLTRRAADLLGVPASAPAQIRFEVESGPSQALRDQLQGGAKGVVAAPRGVVTAESLPAPAGAASRASRVASLSSAAPVATEADAALPDRLPETVRQVAPEPGQLWIRAGQFSQARYANLLKSKLSALPVLVRRGSAQASAAGFVVMAGPFASVATADAALDQARAAGVTDAVIVVE